MPLPLYAFALITLLLSHFYNALPTDIVGGFAIMFIIGAVFGEIGKRLPIFNKYIGGAPVMIFLVAAYFVYAGIFTQKEIEAITNVMDKSNFLNLFIAVLITGAILSVNRKLLLKSLLGYIPTILMGILGASIFGILIGLCFGISVDRIMMLYVLPIMGGGNGAGAVPLSEIYHSVTGRSREEYYSTAIAILTIANIFAIVFAALLDIIGKKHTWLMVGVGVCYTDLQEIIDAITFANVVIAAVIVVGAVVGAAVGGWLIGFFPIESAITAGLCMANRGGSGDLEVLSACNRMNLISYAQISSRLGGGIVLVIASIVFGMMM